MTRTVSIPRDTHTLALAQANEARRVLSVLTKFATLEALEAAEQSIKRMPTKAEMLGAIRLLKRQARAERMAESMADPFAIPAMGAA